MQSLTFSHPCRSFHLKIQQIGFYHMWAIDFDSLSLQNCPPNNFVFVMDYVACCILYRHSKSTKTLVICFLDLSEFPCPLFFKFFFPFSSFKFFIFIYLFLACTPMLLPGLFSVLQLGTLAFKSCLSH